MDANSSPYPHARYLRPATPPALKKSDVLLPLKLLGVLDVRNDGIPVRDVGALLGALHDAPAGGAGRALGRSASGRAEKTTQ